VAYFGKVVDNLLSLRSVALGEGGQPFHQYFDETPRQTNWIGANVAKGLCEASL